MGRVTGYVTPIESFLNQ